MKATEASRSRWRRTRLPLPQLQLQASLLLILISTSVSVRQSISNNGTQPSSNRNLTIECPKYCSCQHEPSNQDLNISCRPPNLDTDSESSPRSGHQVGVPGGVRKLTIRGLKIDFWSSFHVLSNTLSSQLEEFVLEDVLLDPTYFFNSYIFQDLVVGLRRLTICRAANLREGSGDDAMRAEGFTMPYLSNLELESLTLCDNSPTLSSFVLNSLPVVQHITIVKGSIGPLSVDAFEHLEDLKSLNLSHNKIHTIPSDLGSYLPQLATLDLSHNHIEHLQEQIFLGFGQLRHLNVSNNKIRYIDTEVFVPLSSLETVDMSHNEMLQIFEPYFEHNRNLRALLMAAMWSEASFADADTAYRTLTEINRLIDTLQSVEVLDLSHNHLSTIPESLAHMTNLRRVLLHGNAWKCTCDDRWVVPWLTAPPPNSNITIPDSDSDSNDTYTHAHVHDRTIWCSGGSDNQLRPFSTSYIRNHLNCSTANIIARMPIKFYALLGKSAVLKCHPQREPGPRITWLTPKQRRVASADNANAEGEGGPGGSSTHVLENGSMYISNVTSSDFGLYLCVASYADVNVTHYVHLGMDTTIFLDIQYVSIILGWMSSVGFLLTVLVVQLVRVLLNRFGLDCPKPVSPHHAKRVRSFFESLEQHNNSQLDWLRDNYNMQARRIKDNCSAQLERIRESYTTQTKNLSDIRDYGTQQLHTIRDQYFDQIRRVSTYSTHQLCRVRENYLFQRNRVCKFSSHQLLKLRETYKWQAQTLNKILENLPNLNFDTCRGMGACGRTESIYLNDLDAEFLPAEATAALQEKQQLAEGANVDEEENEKVERVALLVPVAAELISVSASKAKTNGDATVVVIIDAEIQETSPGSEFHVIEYGGGDA